VRAEVAVEEEEEEVSTYIFLPRISTDRLPAAWLLRYKDFFFSTGILDFKPTGLI